MRPAFLSELTADPPEWLLHEGPFSDVVLSSRIRLARNLAGFRFPGRADDSERVAVREAVRTMAPEVLALTATHFVDLPAADQTTRRVLSERHLISRDLRGTVAGTGLCIGPDHRLGILINEEDHIRVQGLRPGLDLGALWDELEQVDDRLCTDLSVAFDRRLGFLTACPSNVGTGLRASAMMWLPGLATTGHMKQILSGAQALGLTVRGIFGEGTHALGHVFQISNQSTLGETENGIIFRLEKVVRHLVRCEDAARIRLMSQPDGLLPDLVGRAYGMLRYAARLSTPEAIGALFALRLGIMAGLIGSVCLETVNRLIVSTQPGHLEMEDGTVTSTNRRQTIRARLVREALTGDD